MPTTRRCRDIYMQNATCYECTKPRGHRGAHAEEVGESISAIWTAEGPLSLVPPSPARPSASRWLQTDGTVRTWATEMRRLANTSNYYYFDTTTST